MNALGPLPRPALPSCPLRPCPPVPFGPAPLTLPPRPATPCPQTVSSADGCLRYTVFDKVAVRIQVAEGRGGRRALALTLVPREELPAADQMH